MGTVQVFFEADAPRVDCRAHGVTVAAVPGARHGAGHTRAFDDTAAWLALQCSKTAVTAPLRIGWRTVGSIVKSAAHRPPGVAAVHAPRPSHRLAD